jgi:AhpD family alkylhydroperoxidase
MRYATAAQVRPILIEALRQPFAFVHSSMCLVSRLSASTRSMRSSPVCHVPGFPRVISVTHESHRCDRRSTNAPSDYHPAFSVPGVLDALQALSKAANDAADQAGLPRRTTDLVSLRASQINGCTVCLDMHGRAARKSGESDPRLFTVAGWRDAPYFTEAERAALALTEAERAALALTEAERAALALTEAATRLCDRANPVPDDVWNEAARHYDQQALAALVVHITAINTWNRLNVTTGQIAGEWTAQWAA